MIGPGGKLQNTNMKKVGGGTYISPSAFAQSGVGATTTMKLSEQGIMEKIVAISTFQSINTNLSKSFKII